MSGKTSPIVGVTGTLPLAKTAALLMLCALPFAGVVSAASTAGEAKVKLPLVMFFITHSTPSSCRPGPHIEQSIKDANQELIQNSKGAKGMEPVIRIVFDKRDLKGAALQALTQLQLERKEHRQRKIRAVFLDCEWEMGDPKYRQDRPRTGELQRIQVDLDVECEFCRLWVQTGDRLHKRRPWKKKITVDYLTPRVKVGERPAWTGEDAMRLAAAELVGKLFDMRKKWMK